MKSFVDIVNAMWVAAQKLYPEPAEPKTRSTAASIVDDLGARHLAPSPKPTIRAEQHADISHLAEHREHRTRQHRDAIVGRMIRENNDGRENSTKRLTPAHFAALDRTDVGHVRVVPLRSRHATVLPTEEHFLAPQRPYYYPDLN